MKHSIENMDLLEFRTDLRDKLLPAEVAADIREGLSHITTLPFDQYTNEKLYAPKVVELARRAQSLVNFYASLMLERIEK